MHVQVLSSGSKGNSTLIRAGDCCLLVDAGLSGREMDLRLEHAGLGHDGLQHVFVTHGHLDHARSAGLLARRHRATLHCAEAIMSNASIRRHKRLSSLRIGSPTTAPGQSGEGGPSLTPIELPHDAPPTVAFRIEHEGRVATILTDMGVPRPEVAARLSDAHVLVLEFNHDLPMLRSGPYPPSLQRRVAGNAGHLSNEQAAQMLRGMAGPNLHTLVLAHLSETNNTPELARAAAEETLQELGRADVEVLIASQSEVGPNLAV